MSIQPFPWLYICVGGMFCLVAGCTSNCEALQPFLQSATFGQATAMAMNVALKKQHYMLLNDEKWAIPDNMIAEKMGKEWLLMFPTNYSLCKFVQGETFDRRKNYNLKNIPAFEALIQQRNVKSNLVAEEENLFSDAKDVNKPPAKKRKTTPQEDQEITLDLPDAGGTIRCLNAKKISEALAVEMTEANLSQVFSFLHGSDTSSEKPRGYQSTGKYKGVAAKRKNRHNDE